MPEIEKSIIKRYIKYHPFNSGLSLLIAYLLIFTFVISPLLEKYMPSFDLGVIYFLIWMPLLMIFTGYAARLRGRTGAWGILAGIGIIVIALLPIVRNKVSNNEDQSD